MTSASRLVWRLSGNPAPPGGYAEDVGVCVICGETGATVDTRKALGPNYTDHDLFVAPWSTRVCTACLWVCSGKPPSTLRMWSVVAAENAPANQEKCWLPTRPGLCLTNRANVRPVADTLLTPPPGEWLVCVAISGQKHVVPYGRVNTGPGAWLVRMENTTFAGDPAVWRVVLGAAARLRRAGHSADDILHGRYTVAAVKTREAFDLYRAESTVLQPHVTSPLLELALWCLTKESTDDYANL